MDVSRLTIRQLEIIARIIELKSVSLAATELDLSQSNLSHVLARARTLLGDPLVIMENGKMEPSQKALSLVPRIHEILNLARVDCNGISASIDGLQQTIRLYCTTDIVEQYGPNVFQAFKQKGYRGTIAFPRLSTTSFKRFEQDPLSLLISPTAILPSAMVQRKVFEDDWTLLCADDHPIRTLGEISFSDSLQYEFAIVRPYDRAPNPLDMVAAMYGQKRKVTAYFKNYHEIIPFLISGQSIAIVPSSVASHLASIYPIFCERINRIRELPVFSSSLAWFPKFTHNPLATEVRSVMLGVFNK